MGIRHTCKRRFFLRWGLRRVRGRKSPEKPHNPWHWRDHTRQESEAAAGLRAEIFGDAVVLDGYVAVRLSGRGDVPVGGPAVAEDALGVAAGDRLLERLHKGKVQTGCGQAVGR